MDKNYDAHDTTGIAGQWVVVCIDHTTGPVEVFGPFETRDDAQDYREFANKRGCSGQHFITKMTFMQRVTTWEPIDNENN